MSFTPCKNFCALYIHILSDAIFTKTWSWGWGRDWYLASTDIEIKFRQVKCIVQAEELESSKLRMLMRT